VEDCVFSSCDAVDTQGALHDEKVLNISSQLAGVSFHSPLTRSQLRRQSDTFEFARPTERRWVDVTFFNIFFNILCSVSGLGAISIIRLILYVLFGRSQICKNLILKSNPKRMLCLSRIN
jgi:hypothetical protein